MGRQSFTTGYLRRILAVEPEDPRGSRLRLSLLRAMGRWSGLLARWPVSNKLDVPDG